MELEQVEQSYRKRSSAAGLVKRSWTGGKLPRASLEDHQTLNTCHICEPSCGVGFRVASHYLFLTVIGPPYIRLLV